MKITKCVIPAAGFGTRFLPATKSIPKEMFPVVDKPVIQILVEQAIEAWCEDIIIVINEDKLSIKNHFEQSEKLETKLKNKPEFLNIVKNLSSMANISFVYQNQALWDGHAVLQARDLIWEDDFLVLFWDDIIDNNKSWAKQLLEAYDRNNSINIASIEVPEKNKWSYGITEIESDWKIIKFIEKPKPGVTDSRLAAIGQYVLTNDIFNYLDSISSGWLDWEIRLADAFELILEKKDIYAVSISWDRYDTWDKLWYVKAVIAEALKRDNMREEILDFIKTK